MAIEQLAAVIAAQGDDFELDEILQLEGVSPDSWASAKQHWLPKLAVDETLRAQYDGSLVQAQERLDREVSPIASELDAWVAFLLQCEAHSNEQLAEQHGLTLNDFARLQRKWQARFEADDKLAEQAKQLREQATRDATSKAAPALPISVLARPLRPSPYAPGAESDDQPQTAGAKPALPPLSLEVLAAILIECSLDIELSHSYRSHGFASAAHAQAALIHWQQQLEADPEAQDTLQDILDRRRQTPAAPPSAASPSAAPFSSPSSAGAPAAAPVPAAAGLASNAHAREHFHSPWQQGAAAPAATDHRAASPAVALPPLPFDATGTFQPLSLGEEGATAPVSGPDATTFATPALQPEDALPFSSDAPRDPAPAVPDDTSALDRTTGLDAQLLAIDALPFGPTDTDATTPEAAVPSQQAGSLDTTGFLDSNLLDLDEMPFDDVASPAARFRAAPAPQQQPLQPHQAKPGELRPELRDQDATAAVSALSLVQLARPPLPFATPKQIGAVAPQRRAKASTFVGRLPTLTVDQYACYIAERDCYPEHLAYVMQRYGVPAGGGHGVMALRWAARLVAHPAEQQRYAEAYHQYHEWLGSQRPG